MRKRKTTEQFIAEAKLTHGNKYDYSKVNYITSKDNVTIICPDHGEFQQAPSSHLKKYGCLKCSTLARFVTKEEFINNAIKIHGYKYDYSKVEYKCAKEAMTIICPEHGEFKQIANSHLSGKGCIKCGRESTNISIRLNTYKFIQKALIIHNSKYSYDKTNYVTCKDKVVITCPEHGKFEQNPVDHLQGKGCPNCAKNGFQPNKPAYLYYLKITTDTNQVLYKIGITNRTVNERFNLTDLSKIEIIKQKLYDNGAEALKWETKLKRMYKEYQYKGPDILSSGNTELFTEDIIAMWDNAQVD